MRRFPLAARVLAAAAAVPLVLAAAPAPAPAESLVAATTVGGALRHLAAFQRIADAHEGNRAAGSPGHEASARYAGALLEAAGYRVSYQRFDFPYREPATERLAMLRPERRDVPVRVLTHTASTPPGGLTGELAGAGTGCAAGDFSWAAHAGRIALIERGGCTFADKQANAAAAGAVAAVVYNNGPGELAGTLGGPDASAGIPVGGIGQEDGRDLAAELATGRDVTVRLELAELAEERSTVNVIAETRGGDPSRVVMAGAHLDSVPDGPGINDNGSGSAGVLETALRLAETGGRHPQQVRFALWSAEESGLLGSEHYVASLEEGEREDIALYLNFDMVGSPNHGLFVHEAGENDEEEGDGEREGAVSGDFVAFFRDRGLTARATPFDGRSDYAPFRAAGIPAGGTFTGAEGVKSEADVGLWGGSAGAAYDPCYHEACDDLDNVSRTALDVNVKAIAHAVGRYAWRLP